MSKLHDKLVEEVESILEEPTPEPSEPIRLETEGVFNSELLDSAGYPLPSVDPFMDEPMKILAKMMSDLKDMVPPHPAVMVYDPPAFEHKVKLFRFDEKMVPAQVCSEIEAMLNDGWSCHSPAVCNDYVLMDFSRRKETTKQ